MATQVNLHELPQNARVLDMTIAEYLRTKGLKDEQALIGKYSTDKTLTVMEMMEV